LLLVQVLVYMNHHKGVEPPIIEKPLRSKVMKDVCKDPFDADLIDRIGENRQALYDLILAANYMDIKSLLHLGCAKVGSLIKGVRRVFVHLILIAELVRADSLTPRWWGGCSATAGENKGHPLHRRANGREEGGEEGGAQEVTLREHSAFCAAFASTRPRLFTSPESFCAPFIGACHVGCVG
jgi:hypothetical protein